MKLQFKEQNFQNEAVAAIVKCFEGQAVKTNRFTLERSKQILKKTKEIASDNAYQSSAFESEVFEDIGYRNSAIQITEKQVLENIISIQREQYLIENKNLDTLKGANLGYNFTIEMETGTGKTYTYIRTMYELHLKYGWSKFMIIVPSIAIRE